MAACLSRLLSLLLLLLLMFVVPPLKVGACFWGLPLPKDGKTYDIESGGSIEIVLDNLAMNGTWDGDAGDWGCERGAPW